jgi:hypothetical protein
MVELHHWLEQELQGKETVVEFPLFLVLADTTAAAAAVRMEKVLPQQKLLAVRVVRELQIQFLALLFAMQPVAAALITRVRELLVRRVIVQVQQTQMVAVVE